MRIVIEKRGSSSSLWSNYPRCPLLPVCLHYYSSSAMQGLIRPRAHPRPRLKHPPENYAVSPAHAALCYGAAAGRTGGLGVGGFPLKEKKKRAPCRSGFYREPRQAKPGRSKLGGDSSTGNLQERRERLLRARVCPLFTRTPTLILADS